MSPRDGKTALEAQPGYSLIYHGTDIGVIERIDAQSADGSPALSVRGGISGSLRYTIPVAAVAAVDAADRRVAVDDAVTFEPDSIARDGEVMLVGHTPDLGRRLLATAPTGPGGEHRLPRLCRRWLSRLGRDDPQQ